MVLAFVYICLRMCVCACARNTNIGDLLLIQWNMHSAFPPVISRYVHINNKIFSSSNSIIFYSNCFRFVFTEHVVCSTTAGFAKYLLNRFLKICVYEESIASLCRRKIIILRTEMAGIYGQYRPFAEEELLAFTHDNHLVPSLLKKRVSDKELTQHDSVSPVDLPYKVLSDKKKICSTSLSSWSQVWKCTTRSSDPWCQGFDKNNQEAESCYGCLMVSISSLDIITVWELCFRHSCKQTICFVVLKFQQKRVRTSISILKLAVCLAFSVKHDFPVLGWMLCLVRRADVGRNPQAGNRRGARQWVRCLHTTSLSRSYSDVSLRDQQTTRKHLNRFRWNITLIFFVHLLHNKVKVRLFFASFPVLS